MARVKLIFPTEKPIFFLKLTLRISDINYGGHMGNDAVLKIVHEARLQMLKSWNMSELDAGGHAMIMADAAIEFKNEAFYSDELQISIFASVISNISFDLFYKIEKLKNEQLIPIAIVKTGMLGFDYDKRKITSLSSELKNKLINSEN